MAFGIHCPKCGNTESTPGCFVCDPQPKADVSLSWHIPHIKTFRVKVKLDERTGAYKEYGIHALNEKEAKKIVRKELRKEITKRLNSMLIEEISEPEIPRSGAV